MMEFELCKNLKVSEFATSSIEQKYIVSYNKRNFEVSEAVAKLIHIIQQSDSISQVIHIFKEKGKEYSENEIISLINKFISPIIEPQEERKKHSFIFRIELVSEAMINCFSNVLKILLDKKVMIIMTSLFAIFDIIFFTNDWSNIIISEINLYLVGGIFLFFLISSFIHELGHASACKYFNVNHGGVGFGLYLNLPVFYTDVSEIWILPRKERLIVNIAGVYFQFILLAPLFLLYFFMYPDNGLLKYTIIAVNINLLMTLNPFFKFDGYWIVSDLLGIPNLRERTKELIVYYFNKLRKKSDMPKPYLLLINKTNKIFAVIYSIVVNLFFAFFLCYIMPLFFYNFFKTYPNLINELIFILSVGETPDFSLIQTILGQTIFFVLSVYILIKPFLPLIKKCCHPKKNVVET